MWETPSWHVLDINGILLADEKSQLQREEIIKTRLVEEIRKQVFVDNFAGGPPWRT